MDVSMQLNNLLKHIFAQSLNYGESKMELLRYDH